jgi:hypothetical protein
MPRHHSSVAKPGSRRRTAADFTGGRADRFAPPLSPAPRCYPPPLADAWAHAHGVRPRRAAPLWAGWAAYPCSRARPRSLGEIPPPPAQLAENSFSFSFFPFLFPIFIYIYLYTDILCTKNSLNKLKGSKIIMYNNWHTPPSHHD